MDKSQEVKSRSCYMNTRAARFGTRVPSDSLINLDGGGAIIKLDHLMLRKNIGDTINSERSRNRLIRSRISGSHDNQESRINWRMIPCKELGKK
ncbi:hypothetical protein V6Z11_D07G200500 [Gossypium hirsutum]